MQQIQRRQQRQQRQPCASSLLATGSRRVRGSPVSPLPLHRHPWSLLPCIEITLHCLPFPLLQGLGLDCYQATFEEQEIDVTIVHALTPADLASIGVADRAHQVRDVAGWPGGGGGGASASAARDQMVASCC